MHEVGFLNFGVKKTTHSSGTSNRDLNFILTHGITIDSKSSGKSIKLGILHSPAKR